MTQTLKNPLPPRVPAGITDATAAHLAVGLVDMAIVASRLGFSDEAETMRLAAQAMCPQAPMLDIVYVGIVIGKKQFNEALRLLDGRDDSIGCVYRAYCLYLLEDPLWEMLAREVLERNDVPEASKFARWLLNITELPGADEASTTAPPTIPIFTRKGIQA